MTQQQERRSSARQKVQVKKIFSAHVSKEEVTKNCFLHVYDISEGGVRLHSDIPFSVGETVAITLSGQETTSFSGQPVWTRQIPGGMYVTGMRFVESPQTKDQEQDIHEFIERYSPANKRRSARIQRFLSVTLSLGESEQTFSVYTLDISLTGMRVTHHYPLPEDILLNLTIQLEPNAPAISVQAEVARQEQGQGMEQYVIGLQFKNLTPEVEERLGSFILNSRNKNLHHNTFKPMSDSDFADII